MDIFLVQLIWFSSFTVALPADAADFSLPSSFFIRPSNSWICWF